MEPLSIVVISAAVGGSAGKLAEKAWDSGEKWLSAYFKDHHPKAVEKARQNSLEFLAELTQRIRQLEEAAQNSEETQKRITVALEDPDFSAILKDSLLISARTDRQDTHKILGRLVSERLSCESSDLLALTVPCACEPIKALTPNQLRFLATATALYGLLPEQFHRAELDNNPEIRDSWIVNWLKQKLILVLPENEVGHADLFHIASLSCVQFMAPDVLRTHEYSSVVNFLADNVGLHVHHSSLGSDFLYETDDGKRLCSCWPGTLQHILPTSLGQLIGICVYDELTGEMTDIKSTFPLTVIQSEKYL